jgi:hypothetical protein
VDWGLVIVECGLGPALRRVRGEGRGARGWAARLYTPFPNYLINGTFFGGEKKLITKCVLIFLITFVETFLILGRTERDMIQNVYWSSCFLIDLLHRQYIQGVQK